MTDEGNEVERTSVASEAGLGARVRHVRTSVKVALASGVVVVLGVLAWGTAALVGATTASEGRAVSICEDSAERQLTAFYEEPTEARFTNVEVRQTVEELDEVIGLERLEDGQRLFYVQAELPALKGQPESVVVCVVEFQDGQQVDHGEEPALIMPRER